MLLSKGTYKWGQQKQLSVVLKQLKTDPKLKLYKYYIYKLFLINKWNKNDNFKPENLNEKQKNKAKNN